MICCGNYNKSLFHLALLFIILQVFKYSVSCKLRSSFWYKYKLHKESSIAPEMVGFETHSEVRSTRGSFCNNLLPMDPEICAFAATSNNACISVQFTGALTTLASTDEFWGLFYIYFYFVYYRLFYV